jgi:hypothetical protein
LGFLDHEEEVYAKQFKGISKKRKKHFYGFLQLGENECYD